MGNGNGVAFSPDGVYLAAGHGSSPYLTIYKRDGDTFTKLTNPSALPTGQVNGVAFSPDGVYLAAGQGNSPYLTIYKRDGIPLRSYLIPRLYRRELAMEWRFLLMVCIWFLQH